MSFYLQAHDFTFIFEYFLIIKFFSLFKNKMLCEESSEGAHLAAGALNTAKLIIRRLH